MAPKVIFLNLGDKEASASIKAVKRLRDLGTAAEIYPDNAKMKKQMGYADALRIPYVAIIGDSELADNKVTVKNMTSGEQVTVGIGELNAEMFK